MNPLVQMWDKWRRAIKRIEDDLTVTVNDRVTFGAFGEVVRENSAWIDSQHGTGRFLEFFSRQYVRSTVMGIRRHIKSDSRSFSMVRLLQEMSTHSASITRAFYDARLPLKGARDWRTQAFSFVSSDGKAWSASIIDRDRSEFEKLASNVETFGDKVVAHIDKKPKTRSLKFVDLFQSIDKLDELFCRYNVVLTGSHFSSLRAGNPVNLKRVLSVPFVDPSNRVLQRTGAARPPLNT